jgi:hypothetical protein
VRTGEEVARVRSLSLRGYNHCAISRTTGIPRSTVCGWLNGRAPRFGGDRTRGAACARCGPIGDPFPQMIVFEYAYLLGLYLGDGCLLKHPRGVYRLHVYLDAAYPLIGQECLAAMACVMPSSKASLRRHRRWRMLNLVSYSTHWPHLFPQHGAGPKHERKIALEPWQQHIVERYPGRLLRGLIHPTVAGSPTRSAIRRRPTATRATSSPTAPTTSSASSATPATGWRSRGGRTALGTSRSLAGGRSRSWIAMSDQSAEPL